MTIWDKTVDKWGDWQAAQHIAKKYDDDGYLRKKEQHKQKISCYRKKSVAAYSIQNSPNFNLSISAPDICLYESILTQSMSPYPLNNALIHFMHSIAQHRNVLRRMRADKDSLTMLFV